LKIPDSCAVILGIFLWIVVKVQILEYSWISMVHTEGEAGESTDSMEKTLVSYDS
jgi:hypothetical protein